MNESQIMRGLYAEVTVRSESDAALNERIWDIWVSAGWYKFLWRDKIWHKTKRFEERRRWGVRGKKWSSADVISWGQTAAEKLITAQWFGLIGSEFLHWGQLLWEHNNDHCRDQTISLPAGNLLLPTIPIITPKLLILHPSLIPHLDHSIEWSSVLFSRSLLPLCFSRHTRGAELLMRCWAGEISPAVGLLAWVPVAGVCCCHAALVFADACMHVFD